MWGNIKMSFTFGSIKGIVLYILYENTDSYSNQMLYLLAVFLKLINILVHYFQQRK